MKPLTFGSLFSGVGGADIGLERAGLRCVWQCEIDPWCRKVLARHWPDVRRHDDVRTFTGDGYETPDVIVGGDPCQGNSNAGSVHKRQHADMGTEFVRVIEALRPRIVVRENPYPSRPDALWPWWRMRSELERVGYAVLPFRLRACCVGADHRRDRVFLLGDRANTDGNGLEGQHRQGEPVRDAGRMAGGGVRGRRENSLPAPRVCRSRHEVPDLVDRIRALGNAFDTRVAEWIGRRLIESASANEDTTNVL